MKKSLLITLSLLLLCGATHSAASAQSPLDGGAAPTPFSTPVVVVVTPVSPPTPVPTPAPLQSVNAAVAEEVVAVAKVITYQGRLLSPSTSANKPDGIYEMSFRLYKNATGTAQADLVWGPETQNVTVARGLFTAFLGSVTPFGASVFNGQDLWLGVTVGTDGELLPRTRITAVAYALYAANADTLDGIDSTTFATKAQVMPIVLAADGTGSGLDADYLDGWNIGSFARGYTGTQYSGTLACEASVIVTTHSWPVDALATWQIRPLQVGGRFTWSVATELGGNGLIVYWITITNQNACSSGPWGYSMDYWAIDY